MAKLPAKADQRSPTTSPHEAYGRLIAITGAIRNVLNIFKEQLAQKDEVPQSHVVDRLLEPLAATKVQLTALLPALTTPTGVAYAKDASGDPTLNLAVELPAFVTALDTATTNLKQSLPKLFDADGTLSYKIVQDAAGRPISKNKLTAADALPFLGSLDAVLTSIVD